MAFGRPHYSEYYSISCHAATRSADAKRLSNFDMGADESDELDDKRDEELERLVANMPGARIVKPDEELPPQPSGPQEDPNAVREQRNGLEDMRRGMDAAARLVCHLRALPSCNEVTG